MNHSGLPVSKFNPAIQAQIAAQLYLHAKPNPSSRSLPDPQPQHHQAPALGRPAQGEKEGVGRARVRFVGYRVRPLDPDNFAGSVKDLLDGLHRSSLIQGDEPWRIILETEQVKVGRFCDERTEITITYP